jgi:hypothetical protein
MKQFSASNNEIRDWAFAAGMRLADQNKPLLVNLVIEAMLTIHALTRWSRKHLASSRPGSRAGFTVASSPAANHAPARRSERRRSPRRRRAGAKNGASHAQLYKFVEQCPVSYKNVWQENGTSRTTGRATKR